MSCDDLWAAGPSATDVAEMRETLSELVSDNEALREALSSLEGECHAAMQALAGQVEATKQAQEAGQQALLRLQQGHDHAMEDKVGAVWTSLHYVLAPSVYVPVVC